MQQPQKVDGVNLMAVMPQPDNNKEQTMLNVLSGKTWTAEDVKATIAAQNVTPAEVVEVDALSFSQNGKNFTFNPVQNQNSEQSPQLPFQSQPVDLNFGQVQQVQPQQQNLNPLQPQLQQTNLNQVQPQVQQPILNPEQSQQQNLNQVQPQIQPLVNSLQPQIDSKQVIPSQQFSDLLGVNVVEENSNAAPLSPVQQVQQPEQNTQQAPNQNFQQMTAQNFGTEAQVQTNSTGGGESFAQNLTTPAVNNVSNTQASAQTQNAAQNAQAARENANIPAQIVESARMIRNAENTEMVINLKPEHLGQLTLRISVTQNGAVNASFYSDNAQVRAAIENSLVQLKQELSDQGLKVDNVQVYSGLNDGGLMNGQGGQAWQQQQQNSSGRRINFETLQDEVDAVNPATENVSADGVDYKI